MGIYYGTGAKINLTEIISASLEIGRGTASPDENYIGGNLKISISKILQNKREKMEKQRKKEKESAKNFLDDNPDISDKAKNYILSNYTNSNLKERLEYIKHNPDLSTNTKNLLIRNMYWIGMTKEQARLILGDPKDINTTVTKYRKREQWVYGDIGNRRYYYFEDGKLTSWQN